MPSVDAFGPFAVGDPLHPVYWQGFLPDALSGTGILSSGDLDVTATATDLEIEVAAGTLWYDGAEHELASAETHTLSAGDGSDDRWDTVFFDTSTDSSGVREGTAGSTPDPPDVQGDEVLLAWVYVASGATDVADSDIYTVRPTHQDAANTRYDDAAWTPSASTVKAALDELQEAAQITAYPIDVATDTEASAFPLANADLANSSLTVTAGTALSGGGSVDLGGSTTLNVGGVTDSEIASGTTIARSKLDQDKETASVSSATTTDDEEVIFVDTSGGAVTLTLASADAVDGNEIVVVDVGGSVETDALTIDTEGSETIDGESSITLETNFGAQVLASNGTNWFTAGGGSGGGVDHANVFEGREGGSVANGDQGILVVDELADGETVEVYKAALTTADVQAAPTDLDLKLVTFDNAGGFTTQATLVSGDGSTVHDRETGSPLGSYTNSSGGGESIGVIVDNGTGSSQDVMALVEGETNV